MGHHRRSQKHAGMQWLEHTRIISVCVRRPLQPKSLEFSLFCTFQLSVSAKYTLYHRTHSHRDLNQLVAQHITARPVAVNINYFVIISPPECWADLCCHIGLGSLLAYATFHQSCAGYNSYFAMLQSRTLMSVQIEAYTLTPWFHLRVLQGILRECHNCGAWPFQPKQP